MPYQLVDGSGLSAPAKSSSNIKRIIIIIIFVFAVIFFVAVAAVAAVVVGVVGVVVVTAGAAVGDLDGVKECLGGLYKSK